MKLRMTKKLKFWVDVACENAAQQLGRLPPFVALEPKEDCRLVGKILIKRSFLCHPRSGEPVT
jgi:hypothetical protein